MIILMYKVFFFFNTFMYGFLYKIVNNKKAWLNITPEEPEEMNFQVIGKERKAIIVRNLDTGYVEIWKLAYRLDIHFLLQYNKFNYRYSKKISCC